MVRAPIISTVGKRKTSIARILCKPGTGKMTVNDKDFETYFGREGLRYLIKRPLLLTQTEGNFDFRVNVRGGGPASQADAVKYAIAKAILQSNPDLKKSLKDAGFLTRDAREVERKKYGHRGARRSPQYSKR